MMEAAEKGIPIVRSFFLEYPYDNIARGIKDSFMLGSDLIMAPIIVKC
jgi:alpha-D-xyloside xylohydrolase